VDSVSGRAAPGRITDTVLRVCCGTTTSATSEAIAVTAPTVAMNTGRRRAFRARAVTQAAGVLVGGLGRVRAGRRRGLTGDER
jgi:hypothetical protein